MNTSTQQTIHYRSASLTKKEVISGVITGQIAGLIMALVVVLVFSIFLGTSPFFPVQVIGSMAMGESAIQGNNFLAVLVGVLLHQLGPSLLWGTIYGVMAKRFSIITQRNALLVGLGVGVVSMVGPYLLIPKLMISFHGVDYWNQNVPMLWDWAAHLVFGASFVLYPAVFKKVEEKKNERI
jgi:hypothetical protein